MDTQKAGIIAEERQVQLEITRLSGMVACVTELVGSMVGRLNPVLRAELKSEDADAEENEKVVEIAGNIRSIRYVVESQRDALQSALGRLEI